MKKYVIVTTWNGEGYSEENKIVRYVECLPSEIKEITRLTLAQNEDIGTVADCEELEKENGFVFSSTDGDDGTYQFFELTVELHSFMIDVNVNEVTPLTRKDYIVNSAEFGFSHLDTEARHFVAAEEHNYTLTENDVQFIVVDHSPQKKTTEKEVVLTPLEKRLIERLNSCHQVIDSAAETIAEWFSNEDERGDIYTELLAELAPTEELLREVEGESPIKEVFYLFGNDACQLMLNENFNECLEHCKESGGYSIFKFTDGESSSIDLMNAFNGWSEFCIINEKEYNQLSNI